MLQPFGPNIWIVDGSDVAVAGFRYPTRAAVIRLSAGGLFIWSPVHLTDKLRTELDALGTVRHIVAPNSLHHLFLHEWKQAFPNARLYAPPRLQKTRPDLAFDAELDDESGTEWSGEIESVVMHGNLITAEVVFFHKASGTALFTDLLQQIPAGHITGWRRLVAKLDLMVEPEPSVPRKFRIAFTNRGAARNSLKRILDWPVEKVLMAHGAPVERDGLAFINRSFKWLKP
ncbi:DUF4336 domain-containing protein [Rhodoplanes sp. Z2-YC6860]|uniref:DUF4336 domain-containing protein n=1 Tax=Rhodoplanes sp. Z2-YC6860 TaxID=674703 RepID=UPI00078CA879|nr:DUF4336 domain-containing protein [Rhodoplanes sp. Z2-YC6860]AMN44995.1 hypothetical protein RHPLAN_65890 [Rhodoplanes sp. Z2-YC6860]